MICFTIIKEDEASESRRPRLVGEQMTSCHLDKEEGGNRLKTPGGETT